MKIPKKRVTAELTAQEFLNVKEIKNGLLYSKDGYLFGYLFVKAKTEELLSEDEKKNFYSRLTKAVEGEQNPWQLLSIPRTVDTSSQIAHLMKLRRMTNQSAKLDLIGHEIEALHDMARKGAKEPLIIYKSWERDGKKAEQTIKKRLAELCTDLNHNGVAAQALSDQDITFVCKVFADLGEHQSQEEEVVDTLPTIGKAKKRKKKPEDGSEALLSLITPVGGIAFENNKTLLGGVTGRVYGSVNYPAGLDYGWLSKVMNCTEAVTAITFTPLNNNDFADALSSSATRNRREAQNIRDLRERKKFERQADNAEEMISDVDEQGESFGQVSIMCMPFSVKEEELDEVQRRVISLFSKHRIKMKVMGQLQKQAFHNLSPYHVPDAKIHDITNRLMPLYTLMGGSPMTVSVFKDDNGLFFAKTPDGGIIALDFFKRGKDRTNSNIVALGKSGTGKSTAIKHIIEMLYICGVKIIIIDPEREYKDLCRNLGGSWLDAGGGLAKINILQVRPVPEDDDDETDPLYAGIDNALAFHMKTLETFLNTYLPSLSDLQMALLKESILELYDNFGITWDTDVKKLKPEDFPIFSDLYQLLKKKEEKNSKFEDIASLFVDIAKGADSFLWNGHTNIDTDNDVICFDTNKLGNSSDKIKRTQYFNIMTMSWEMMSHDREQPVLLVSDENYIIVDPAVPQTLMYQRNVSKRARKYNSAIAIVSHSIIDFLDERIRMYGQALLEMPTYKLFFGTEGKDIQEITDLYNLTEPERRILQNGVRGQALFTMGSQRMEVRFELPDYKLDYMGKGGGN